MTDKSINASHVAEKGFLGVLDAYMWRMIGRHLQSPEIHLPLSANNGYDSGINPTDSTETRM